MTQRHHDKALVRLQKLLPTKTYNALIRAGYDTLDEITNTTDADMLKWPMIGKVGLVRIRCAIASIAGHKTVLTNPYCTFCKKSHLGGDTCMGHYP